ncbi:MAG: hypothetical protein ABJQ71_22785 [Roseibium sp.]
MQFRLCEDFEFWWPVSVQLPHPDKTGEVLGQDFEARFLMLDQDRLAELEREGQEVLLQAIVKDWRLVEGDDGDEMPFSSDNFAKCLP